MNSSNRGLTISHPVLGSKFVTLPAWNPSSTWRFGWVQAPGAANDRHILEDVYVRDDTPNSSPVLVYQGDTGSRFDDRLPTFSWDVSDRNGNINSHLLTLEKYQEDGSWLAIRSITRGGTTKPAVESQSLTMLPSDLNQHGFGQYRATIISTDKTGRSSSDSSDPIAILDDDPTPPLIAASLGGAQPIANGATLSLPHQDATNITWTISDQQLVDSRLTDSGIAESLVTLHRDEVLVDSSASANDQLNLMGLGPGLYEFRIEATDNDRDHGVNASTDQASAVLTAVIELTNEDPVLRLGPDRSVRQRETTTFSPLDFFDTNGDAVNVAWSFDDGTTYVPGVEVEHAFVEVGNFTVLAKAEDTFGASTTRSIDVTVVNSAPSILEVMYNSSYAVGETVELQVVAVDQPQSGLTYEVDWDGDGTYDGSNSDGLFTTVLPLGVQVVSLRATDADGLSTERTVAFAVGDLPLTQPTVMLTSAATTVSEGSSDLVITATLSEPTTVDVAVPLLFHGTAGNQDYSAPQTTIVVPAGQTASDLAIGIIDDPLFEGNESLMVEAGTPIAAEFVGDPLTFQILDNESVPEVWFSRDEDGFPESSGTIRFSAQLSHPAAQEIQLPLDISGSASSGFDYRLSSSTLLVKSEQTFGVVDLTLIDDPVPEVLETILFRIGENDSTVPTANPALSNEYLVRISANDAPIVSLESSYLKTDELAGSIVLTATLSDSPATSVLVDASLSGNAPLPEGVSEISFVFEIGQTTATASIPIVDDSLPGAEDYTVVSLTEATGADDWLPFSERDCNR